MKAFYITAPRQTQFRDIEKPVPTPGMVLLKVGIVGLCGSDLNAYRGTSAMQRYPMIPGHEVAATIEAIGPEAPKDLRPGMRVTVSPYSNCGLCAACRRGRPNACLDNRTMGVQRPGAMTSYITARPQDIHISDKLSLKELALVEPLTVGFHAAGRGRIAASDSVAVFGCGLVGLGAVSGSAELGAMVIAVDIDRRKLEIAAKAGAKHTVNSADGNLHERLLELTAGRGPDVVIEAVGLPATFLAAVEEVAFTGRVVYIGYSKQPVEYQTKLFVQKELDILGSRNCLGNFPAVIAMLEAGRFPVDDCITRILPLEEAPLALAQWDSDTTSVTKILIEAGL